MPAPITSATSDYLGTLKPLDIDVVSVQSQVIYGRVGNNVAVPTLHNTGLAVASVPTVLFSNTPHYPSIHGGVVPHEWFSGFLADLEARKALNALQAVLIGYLGEPHQTRTLGQWIQTLREPLPDLLVVLDPVMGDEDSGIYVTQGLQEGMISHLLPEAQGLTPNGFELGCLTGLPVGTLDEVVASARTLLNRYPKMHWICATSAAPDDCPPDEIQVAIITRSQHALIRHPKVQCTVKGTGDLFSATLTARLLRGESLMDAARLATNQVVLSLEKTRDAGCGELLLAPFD
ncbi:MAG: pyridoxine/pyridoxal/pyridoxamine kinase [Lautropia sp.]|nr:pyridoxine/pyridoxal/pyridoxamine kinase [Lautropia sp.]